MRTLLIVVGVLALLFVGAGTGLWLWFMPVPEQPRLEPAGDTLSASRTLESRLEDEFDRFEAEIAAQVAPDPAVTLTVHPGPAVELADGRRLDVGAFAELASSAERPWGDRGVALTGPDDVAPQDLVPVVDALLLGGTTDITVRDISSDDDG